MEHDEIHVKLLNEENDVQEKMIEKKNSNIRQRIHIKKSAWRNNREVFAEWPRFADRHCKDPQHVWKVREPSSLFRQIKEGGFHSPPTIFCPSQKGWNCSPQSHYFTRQENCDFSKGDTTLCSYSWGIDFSPIPSSEGFDAGRPFWQVEGRGMREWSFGVYKESFPRNASISPSPSNSCWWIQLSPTTPGAGDSGNPCRIGVFLDYELGEISFYSLNNRSPLYLYSEIFTEKTCTLFLYWSFFQIICNKSSWRWVLSPLGRHSVCSTFFLCSGKVLVIKGLSPSLRSYCWIFLIFPLCLHLCPTAGQTVRTVWVPLDWSYEGSSNPERPYL